MKEVTAEESNLNDKTQDNSEAHVDIDALLELENITLIDDDDDRILQDLNEKANKQFLTKVNEIKSNFGSTKLKQSFNLMNLIRNDEDLIAFTGLSHDLLNSLTEVVEICEKKQYSVKFINSARERIVLCFVKLRLN